MVMFLLLVGVMLLLLGGTAGIVLFILGLVKHKPSMWGSGIVLGVLTLLLLAGGIVALGYYLFMPMPGPQLRTLVYDPNSLSVAQVPSNPNAERAAEDLRAARSYFQDRVGAVLPDGVSVIWREKVRFFGTGTGSGPSTNTDNHLIKLSVPPGFQRFLAANFKETQWRDVKDAFADWRPLSPYNDPNLPEEDRLKALPFYNFTQPRDPNADVMFITSVALDPNSNQAWVVGKERRRASD